MTKPDLQKLRELAMAATPGPWSVDGKHPNDYLGVAYRDKNGRGHVATVVEFRSVQGHADAAFIAAANPTAVIALLDEIETWHRIAERDHGAPIETVEKLREQLAAMTRARNEACEIAWRRGRGEFPPEDSDRLAELRKVDAK